MVNLVQVVVLGDLVGLWLVGFAEVNELLRAIPQGIIPAKPYGSQHGSTQTRTLFVGQGHDLLVEDVRLKLEPEVTLGAPTDGDHGIKVLAVLVVDVQNIPETEGNALNYGPDKVVLILHTVHADETPPDISIGVRGPLTDYVRGKEQSVGPQWSLGSPVDHSREVLVCGKSVL